jgi:hypothetical protein
VVPGGSTALNNRVASHGIRVAESYQPASHYWPFQWSETGCSWPSLWPWPAAATGGSTAADPDKQRQPPYSHLTQDVTFAG